MARRPLWSRLLAIVLLCASLVMLAPAPAKTQSVDTGPTTASGLEAWQYTLISLGLGGILYYFLRPHHPRTVSPPPTPFPATTSRPPGVTYTPPASPTPDIVVYTPTPVPTIMPCQTWQTSGYMEPVQGVWQDDLTFDDKPHKQITLVKKPAFYEAELPMVAGRDTVLYGIDHYQDGGVRKEGPGHSRIVIAGQTTCTKPVEVTVHFSLRDGPLFEDLGTSVRYQIPLDGPPLAAGATADWRVEVYPQPYSEKRAFKLLSRPYHVWGEIFRDSDPTGFRVDVIGDVVHTEFPPIIVQPLLLSNDTTDPRGLLNDVKLLEADARITATSLRERAADYVPGRAGQRRRRRAADAQLRVKPHEPHRVGQK